MMKVCNGSGCPSKGAPQPQNRFSKSGGGYSKRCARCREMQRQAAQRWRSQTDRVREARVRNHTTKAEAKARVLTRQLRIERAARLALARELDELKRRVA